MDGFGLFDGYAGYFAGFNAHVYDTVPAAHQSVSGEVGVAACVGRCTQYQCFFIGHSGITCKVGIWFFSSGGRWGFYRGLTEGGSGGCSCRKGGVAVAVAGGCAAIKRLWVYESIVPLIRRGRAFTFDAPKVTKLLSAIRLLCRTGLCPANRAEPRAAKSCPASRPAYPSLLQVLLCPSRPQPTTFCPLSPEAELLTV